MGVTTAPARPAPARSVRLLRWLRPLALATLGVNILIVVTGGVVRLTGSGLGCPTWPTCTDDSFTPHGAMDFHAAIEFGNRTVTFVMVAIAVATYLAARASGRQSLVRLALVLGLGVPAQALIGGVTVLTKLNPWVVSLHLVTSLAMIAVAVTFLLRIDEGDGPVRPLLSEGKTRLVRAVGLTTWVVLYVGTVVTGSGPHAGDAEAPRNGLDPRALSQLHTDFVFLLLGLTVATVLVVDRRRQPGVRRAALLLLVAELAQGLIGFVQYYTDLPVVLVALHLLGAAVLTATMARLMLSSRTRLPERGAPAEPATTG